MPNHDIQLPRYTADPVALSNDQVVDWGHSFLKAASFYPKSRGEGAIIFILDTAGTFQDHDDLKGNCLSEHDFNRTNSPDKDANGHGTHCAGIAAATDNAIGVIGIAPKAKLAARKVLNDSGGGDFRWIANDIRAIADIPNTGRIKGLKRIISMSLGGAPKQEAPQFLKDAIDYAISKGCFVLAAAGNSGDRGSGAPGNYQPVITIGSTDRPGNIRSSFSARDNSLDFVAPGGRIHSTYKDNGYAIVSGTSMSTPMVAGVVALIVTEFNINTQTDLCKFLKKNATDILSPGKDDLSGWGVPILDKYTSGPSRPDEGIEEPAPSPEPEPEQPYLPRRRGGVAMNMEIPKDEVYITYWREESEIEVDPVIVKNIELILKTDVLAEQAHEIIIAFLRRVFFEFAFVLPDESDLHDVAVWTAAHAQSLGKEDWVQNEFGTTLDITITSLSVRNRFGNEVKVYTDDIVQSANKLAFGSMDTEVFSMGAITV